MGLSELRKLIRESFPKWNKIELPNAGMRCVDSSLYTLNHITEKNREEEFVQVLQHNLPSNTFLWDHPLKPFMGNGMETDPYSTYFVNPEWKQLKDGDNVPTYGEIICDGNEIIFEPSNE